MTTQLPDYPQVTQALQVLNAIGEAAETHGLLCALFGSNVGLTQDAWLDSMLSKHLPAGDATLTQAQKVLTQLFESTKTMFANEQFALQLLLPADEAPFEARLEALVHWCQGFLSGLNRMGLNSKSFTPEVSDALQDLNKIACLDYSNETADEASENAYVELIEYVRIAVLSLYGELQTKLATAASKTTTLH